MDADENGEGGKRIRIPPHISRKPAEKPHDTAVGTLRRIQDEKITWLVLLALFILFVLTRQSLLGVAIAVWLAFMLFIEVRVGIATGGLRSELKETALAILVAAAIWYGLGFALSTSTPLDAVVSCSMLPNLQRGDLVVLQGAEPAGPVVRFTQDEWDRIARGNALTSTCGGAGGLFEYECGTCQRSSGGSDTAIACVKGLREHSNLLLFDRTGDIIVYRPLPTDPFARSGDIVHRVAFIASVEGKNYYFTKGDNNNLLDVQIGNRPVTQDRIMGRVVLRLPYIGYFKLFISGLFKEPDGCDSTLA